MKRRNFLTLIARAAPAGLLAPHALAINAKAPSEAPLDEQLWMPIIFHCCSEGEKFTTVFQIPVIITPGSIKMANDFETNIHKALTIERVEIQFPVFGTTFSHFLNMRSFPMYCISGDTFKITGIEVTLS